MKFFDPFKIIIKNIVREEFEMQTRRIEELQEELSKYKKENQILKNNLQTVTAGLRGVYQILQQLVELNTRNFQ